MMRAIAIAVAIAGGLCLATPASADFCVQMSGGLSGDLGFFRFRGRLPKKPGNFLALHGRVAGLGPAFGTVTRAKDDSFIELGATFFADATEGQFDVFLYPPSFTAGNGYSNYGDYDVNDAVTVAVVDCNLEP